MWTEKKLDLNTCTKLKRELDQLSNAGEAFHDTPTVPATQFIP